MAASGACAYEALERYIDGDLCRSERTRLETHLQACDRCKAELAALEIGGSLLREHLDAVADEADFTLFEDRILTAIAAEPPLALGERVLLWLRESFWQHRGAWIATAVAALLLIALLLPFLGGGALPKAVDNEVIIDSLEYKGDRSMIFTVSRNNTTVIWMYDFDGSDPKAGRGDEL